MTGKRRTMARAAALLAALAITLWPMAARAGEGGPLLGGLSAEVKLDFVDKYIWRGMDLLAGHPAFQPELTLIFGESGFYAGVWSSYAIDGKCHDPYGDVCSSWNEHDIYAGYGGALAPDARFAANYDVSYTYYHFPWYPVLVDSHEVALAVSHPNLIGAVGGVDVAPYYTIYQGWPAYSGGVSNRWAKIGLRQSWSVAELPFSSYVEGYYTDGKSSYGFESGFVNIAAGVKATFTFGPVAVTPAVNYQWALMRTPQPGLVESEPWASLRFSASF